MPPRVIHCQSCRALLNSELSEDSIEIPAFVPLPEIAVIAAASAKGHYVLCPGCNEELRIHSKYKGLKVQCKHCNVPFTYRDTVIVKAFYTPCPHCKNELRADPKYMGHKVVCKHCDGHIQLQSN
jgi:Zn finger protein HypA/HybF involved in hydrogenase expression